MNSLKKSQKQEQYYSSKSSNKKKRLTEDQVRVLEASFEGNNKLDPQLKHQLSNELDIPPRQIAIWYQNKRARWKNQSLELDYTALHMRLQSALTQKRQLEKEAQRLRVELQNSQARVLMNKQVQVSQAQQPPPPPPPVSVSVSSISSNCDQVGSSSLYDDQVNWINDHDRALGVDEFYACLIGTTYASNFS